MFFVLCVRYRIHWNNIISTPVLNLQFETTSEKCLRVRKVPSIIKFVDEKTSYTDFQTTLVRGPRAQFTGCSFQTRIHLARFTVQNTVGLHASWGTTTPRHTHSIRGSLLKLVHRAHPLACNCGQCAVYIPGTENKWVGGLCTVLYTNQY